MRKPATADERERRMIEYLCTLHQGRLAEFKLTRLNRVANLRKKLMELLNEMIESRAEDLAAGMLMQYAPPRPARQERNVVEGRLPIGPKRAVRRPAWVRVEEGTGRRSTKM